MKELRVNPDVVLLQIEKVYILAAAKNARKVCPYIREIDEVGAFIWKQLEKKTDSQQIAALLREEYLIPEGTDLNADIDEYINNLKNDHYLIPIEEDK